MGKVARDLFPTTKSLPTVANAGDMLYVVSFFVALIMWGFALVWFFIAVATIAESSRVPFNMGWWGFVFPIGSWLPRVSTALRSLELTSGDRHFRVVNLCYRPGVGVEVFQSARNGAHLPTTRNHV